MSELEFNPALLLASEVKSIHEVLIGTGHLELAQLIREKASRTDSDRKYSESIKLWDEGTFDIDDEPIISESEDGAYVMVWQWVDKSDLGTTS